MTKGGEGPQNMTETLTDEKGNQAEPKPWDKGWRQDKIIRLIGTGN